MGEPGETASRLNVLGKVLPENLGLVDLLGWNGYGQWLPADIVRAATANLAVRDGWASSYFHPLLDIEYLRRLCGV